MPEGGGSNSTWPPAGSMACLAAAPRRRGPRPGWPGGARHGQHLTRAPLLTRPDGPRVAGVATSPAKFSSVSRLTDGVGDAERVVETLQLGDALGQRQLAALETGLHRVAGALTLRPRPAVLPPLPRDAASDRRLGAVGTGGRAQIVEFHDVALPSAARRARRVAAVRPALGGGLVGRGRLHRHQVGDARDHAPDLGAVGEDPPTAHPPQPRARRVPRCLGLVPMAERTCVTFSSPPAARAVMPRPPGTGLGALAFAVGAKHAAGDDLVGGLAPQASHVLGPLQGLEPGDGGVGHVDPVGTTRATCTRCRGSRPSPGSGAPPRRR